MTHTQKVAVGAVALVSVFLVGGAVAATRLTSPQEESKAVVNDVAGQLGVSPERLTQAFKTAMKNRIDRAVADGRMTKAEGDALKQRIDESDAPLLGPGFHRGHRFHDGPDRGPGGPGFHHHKLDAAAKYLGLSESALRTQLESGKTLAQVARDRNKPVSGLVDALVAESRTHIEKHVKEGRLTRAEADEFLQGVRARVTNMVNGRFPRPDRMFRHRGPGTEDAGAVFLAPAV